MSQIALLPPFPVYNDLIMYLKEIRKHIGVLLCLILAALAWRCSPLCVAILSLRRHLYTLLVDTD